MTSAGSVSDWLRQLQAGDHDAVEELWQRYYQRLVRLARKKLLGQPRRMADEEDVALSAFDSFCRRAERGAFPRLLDRHDLWQVLLVLTARKALKLIEHERALKRGGGEVRGESALLDYSSSEEERGGLDRIIGAEPSPEFAVQMAEEYRRLLDLLGDPALERIAVMKMEGWTNVEIADELHCVVRTVERRLQLIRDLWAQEVPS